MLLGDSRGDPILPVVDQGNVMGSNVGRTSEDLIEGNSRDGHVRFGQDIAPVTPGLWPPLPPLSKDLLALFQYPPIFESRSLWQTAELFGA